MAIQEAPHVFIADKRVNVKAKKPDTEYSMKLCGLSFNFLLFSGTISVKQLSMIFLRIYQKTKANFLNA